MRNIYNKGKYRSGEWAKHLRPFLKRKGNKQWRKEGKQELALNIDYITSAEPEKESVVRRVPRKEKKRIKATITIEEFNGFKNTVTRKFRSVKSLRQSLKRNKVLRFHVYDET